MTYRSITGDWDKVAVGSYEHAQYNHGRRIGTYGAHKVVDGWNLTFTPWRGAPSFVSVHPDLTSLKEAARRHSLEMVD